MKEKILIICLACLPVLLPAQEKIPCISADLGIGQEWIYNKTAVKLLKILSDSRCPNQVTCMWAGEARVLLGITTGEEYVEKEVVVSGSDPELVLQAGLRLLFFRLKPYPEMAKGIAPEEYCLEFVLVSDKENQ